MFNSKNPNNNNNNQCSDVVLMKADVGNVSPVNIFIETEMLIQAENVGKDIDVVKKSSELLFKTFVHPKKIAPDLLLNLLTLIVKKYAEDFFQDKQRSNEMLLSLSISLNNLSSIGRSFHQPARGPLQYLQYFEVGLYTKQLVQLMCFYTFFQLLLLNRLPREKKGEEKIPDRDTSVVKTASFSEIYVDDAIKLFAAEPNFKKLLSFLGYGDIGHQQKHSLSSILQILLNTYQRYEQSFRESFYLLLPTDETLINYVVLLLEYFFKR